MDKLLISNWWVILFLLVAGFLYERGVFELGKEYRGLEEQKLALVERKKRAQERQIMLNRQINCLSDPEWIELTLIKSLGVIPEGYQKVYFKNGN